MNLTAVALVSFAGLASLVAAVGLLLRDLFTPRANKAESASGLGRLPLARLDTSGESLTGRMDHAFNRLVIESGLECSPMAAFLAIVCLGLLCGAGPLLSYDDPLLAAVAMISGMAVAYLALAIRRGRRMRLIRNQLPDVLDLLARAVRAGESLDQAIELVGDKSAEPLAKEFRRCARHLSMGLSLPAAMRALVHRVQIVEMRIFATTVSVHRQSGGNLALTLERMPAVIRDRLVYRRQLRATTAAGRFSALLVASIGPLLFAWMFLIQPQYVENMLVEPLGQTLLMAAVVLEILGLVWVFRMLRTEY